MITLIPETKIHALIKEIYLNIELAIPIDGLSSPRDLKLVTEINKAKAVADKLEEAMRIAQPNYEYNT